MIIYTLIIFGLATARSIAPLVDKKNYEPHYFIFAALHLVAYIFLISYFISKLNC